MESVINKTKCALILIDMISDFEFEDGEKLFQYALPAAKKLAELKSFLKKKNIPVIYVNDNYGKWQEDFKSNVEHCLTNDVRGQEIVSLLKPDNDDYYILKPKHSAFYKTAFEHLLEQLKIETLILSGISTDICVLFTANDAYMREYKIIIPEDCVAAVTEENTKYALNYIKNNLDAEVANSANLKNLLSQ